VTRNLASVKEIVVYFLKLGFIAFGGPAARIAMMEEETVRRRHWLTREKFLDLLGTTNLISGPSSTELAIYIGCSGGVGRPGEVSHLKPRNKQCL
jgi:chromate transporter